MIDRNIPSELLPAYELQETINSASEFTATDKILLAAILLEMRMIRQELIQLRAERAA